MKTSLSLLAGLALMGMYLQDGVAAAATDQQGSNINIELAQKTGQVMNTPARLQKALAKYNLESRVSPSRLNMAASTIDLSSVHVDVEYVGTIGVGNPPQLFQMDFDTGSADIWIPHVGCAHCGKHPLFDPADSSTFSQDTNQTWGLRYGDGSGVQGIIGRDTVHLGELSYPDQVLGLVQGESVDLAMDPELDGIFGLAYAPLAFTGHKKSIVQGMQDMGVIPSASVGVYLGRARDGGKGELVSFGKPNPAHYEGELKYVPVTEKKFWQVALNGLKINGQETLSKPIEAIIDTGTTLIILPSELAETIHATIPGATFSSMYGWRMPCDLKASAAGDAEVTFTLGDHDFSLRASELVRERASPSEEGDVKLCYSGIAEAKTPLIIMGDTFLRSYYSVFDFDKDAVGLAPAKP
ncbi:aspartic peptidase domain-containing protein [Zychaea mexicana]|uniref:aspartic peptidase domain-containing protein n=1 Tax=Zychaea mexicana TaxID=64656 RepID=UPI0022FE2053|nr:aspartic peptidase domain-containing protein [Zychaea mexicana]KAI9495519.1 aspartic peptidase domain-containing protein [Zychaea mexicana]